MSKETFGHDSPLLPPREPAFTSPPGNFLYSPSLPLGAVSVVIGASPDVINHWLSMGVDEQEATVLGEEQFGRTGKRQGEALDNPIPPGRVNKRQKLESDQRFGCPWSKKDPSRYEKVYGHACTTPPGLEGKRITEHARRVHSCLKETKCRFCGTQWASEGRDRLDELEQHQGICSATEDEIMAQPEYMTAPQEQVLKDLDRKVAKNDKEAWVLCYMRLFPGEWPVHDPGYNYLVPRHLTTLVSARRQPTQSEPLGNVYSQPKCEPRVVFPQTRLLQAGDGTSGGATAYGRVPHIAARYDESLLAKQVENSPEVGAVQASAPQEREYERERDIRVIGNHTGILRSQDGLLGRRVQIPAGAFTQPQFSGMTTSLNVPTEYPTPFLQAQFAGPAGHTDVSSEYPTTAQILPEMNAAPTSRAHSRAYDFGVTDNTKAGQEGNGFQFSAFEAELDPNWDDGFPPNEESFGE